MRIFIASAMKPRQDARTRELTLAICTRLREEYGSDAVYLAPGGDMGPREAFEESERQIRQADAFVLFCPEGPVSPGALVELGVALALDKHVLALIRSPGEALPYFLWQGTKTMVSLITDRPDGVPGFWGPAEHYFLFIRTFIRARLESVDGLTDAEARAQLEARLPVLNELRQLDVKTQEFLRKG